jgi:Bacterial pre-peptidase C-terminal domain
VTIYWSTRNKKTTVGTTYFNVANSTAYVLGDRDTDSDEFDDAVLVHEYAHLLAAKFSRDDSPGGPHSIGDMLDPRLAWSEGWANVFSSIVRNDPVWRDSSGLNGAIVYRFDVEENAPPADKEPGYWSEASVDSILWDIFDEHVDAGDDVQYAFAQIWAAFTDLRNDRFVYLPYFLEHFIARYPSSADAIRAIVQSRSIDFQPNVRPSVAYPFPTPMAASSVSGAVDSLTAKRANLVTSSHFYSFTTTGGAATIRLDITGLGPADNPNGNDLDLFLMDANGRMIDRSDSGLNGQAERIALRLPAGTYVVEIRSYYTKAETGGFVFNSGQYRLSVSIQ